MTTRVWRAIDGNGRPTGHVWMNALPLDCLRQVRDELDNDDIDLEVADVSDWRPFARTH